MRHLIAGLLLSALAAAGYQAAEEDKSKLARLEGRVVNLVTGEPVRKAKLTLAQSYVSGQQGPRDARTVNGDAEGRFLFEDLAPGTYLLSAEKAGFLHEYYGSVALAAGQHLKDLEFKLTPQAVIAGRVLDDEGEPAGQAVVNVSRLAGSRSRSMPTGGGQTNDLGEFRIAELAPGRYVLGATPTGGPQIGQTAEPRSDKPEEALATTYYPGVLDLAAASAVEVKAGQQLTGIDINLQKTRVYRVEGRIAGLTPARSARNLNLSVTPREHEDMSTVFLTGGAGGGVKPDGSFELVGVRPGAYYLTMYERADMGRPAVVGRIPIDVADAGLKGVVVPIIEPLQVSGTMRVEGEPKKLSLDALRVMLRQADGASYGNRPAAVNPDGSFKIGGLMPDRYSVMLMGVPETAYLKSVRLGKQEASDSSVDLSQAQGAAVIELVLGTNPGSVEGTVRQDAKPVPGSVVALVPDSVPAMRLKTASADQNGKFTLRGVAPGDYKLYAWPPTLDLNPWDADALKGFEQKAVRVIVREGAAAQADLTPLKPEDEQPQ